MKLNYSTILKSAAAVAVIAIAGCSDDDIVDQQLVEFGTTGNTYTVDATAGHVDLKLYSNQHCRLEFEDETPWAELNVYEVVGDSKVYIDYDDNTGFPRMAKVLVHAVNVNLTDTIVLRQRGLETPGVSFDTGSIILKGSAAGTDQQVMTTNLDFASDITPAVTYTGGEGTDWVTSVTEVDGKLSIEYVANPSSNPRSATLDLVFDNGWGEPETTTLFLTQMSHDDMLGTDVSFETVMDKGKVGGDVTIEDFYIITGYVVSNKESANAGDNPQTTPTSIDYTVGRRTVYLESLDGNYGFSILCDTEADNVFDQYDKIKLLIKGATLHTDEDPYRYELSGINTTMIIGRTAGTRSDLPVKAKYIRDLTDTDIYTYVTLKDCEFPVRQGSLTPVHEGYTLGDNQHRLAKYPRLVRDINGSSIYLYTNTTCPYRRDGRKLPYGSGNLSGVVVFEYYKPYIYGDGYDTDTHGRIGTYQIRHQNYSDIDFHDSESFSGILTEYQYLKDRKRDATDGLMYFYPSTGNNGRFCHTSKNTSGSIYSCTNWNYIGWVGTAKGVEPFRNHVGDEKVGTGIYNADGSMWAWNTYDNLAQQNNLDGKGQSVNHNGNTWATLYWWDKETETTPETTNAWRIEFSTEGINTDHLSMQISTQGGRGLELACPIFWKAEWGTEEALTDESKWQLIDEYQVPDFPIWANYHEWQLPAFKQIDFELPLEMLGKKKVYVRLIPASKACNTTFGFNAGEITNPYSGAGNAMDYFAIRYNKK